MARREACSLATCATSAAATDGFVSATASSAKAVSFKAQQKRATSVTTKQRKSKLGPAERALQSLMKPPSTTPTPQPRNSTIEDAEWAHVAQEVAAMGDSVPKLVAGVHRA